MPFLQNFFSSRENSADPAQFVGQEGRLWYDSDSNSIRVSDGVTPGGLELAARSPAFGSFYSLVTQINPVINSANAMAVEVTAAANLMSVAAGNQIVLARAGVYNIQFSCQINHSGGGSAEIDIWLYKNGANVPASDTKLFVQGNNAKTVAAWNFLESFQSGEYFQIRWSSPDAALSLWYQAAQTNPDRPALPSVILTVVPVGS